MGRPISYAQKQKNKKIIGKMNANAKILRRISQFKAIEKRDNAYTPSLLRIRKSKKYRANNID